MKPHRSLFSLVMFCATSSLVAALGLAVLITTVTVAFAVGRTIGSPEVEVQASAPETPATTNPTLDSSALFSGVITDDRCGAKHDMGSDKTSSECARACVRDGSSFALVDGDKKYKLEGNHDELASLAGLRVTVSGILLGDTIKVGSLSSH